MTLLELMAKAAYEEWISGVECVEPKWDDLEPSHQTRLVLSLRAALMTAANANMPMSVIARAEGRQSLRIKISNALEAIALS